MDLKLRRGVPADSAECGRICFEAFKNIAERHNFPPDFPSPDVASGLMALLIAHPNFYSTVAELGGRIVGSNFLDERSQIAGVGPITVDPNAQTQGIGRQLMENVLVRTRERGFRGVRLVQAGYNNQTLCLYTKLGFRTREPLSLVKGSPPRVRLTGYNVRSASKEDIATCNSLCRTVHGHDRAGELEDAVGEKTATVVERLSRVTGYATSIGFFSHAVSETNEDNGSDRCCREYHRAWHTGTNPKPCALQLVLETAAQSADDTHEHRHVLRARRRLLAISNLLNCRRMLDVCLRP
jgi:predicted N-acetyltransferase YhbS